MAYRKVKTLSRTDAAYIAGLIDGEGTISLTRRHRNENRQLEVSIASTEMALLEFVHNRVGAGRIAHKKRYSEKHRPSATYLISNRQALAFVTQIAPYLKSYKARRARIVIENYVRLTPRNGVYSEALRRKRQTMIKQFLETHPVD